MAPLRRPTRLARWWKFLRVILSFVLLGVAGWFIAGKSSELSGASVFLSHLRWQWLAVGGLAELCSYLALAQLQRSLLRAGGVRARLRRAALITFSGSAIQAALPAGAAFAVVYEFRQYQFVGADEILSGFVVIGSAVVAFATLALLAGIGLALAASMGSANNLAEAILGVVIIAGLVVLCWARRAEFYRLALRVAKWAETVFRRPPGQWSGAIVSAWDRARTVAPGPADMARAATASGASWLADCMCLATAFLAVGAHVPWQGLLLAYCGGQLAVNLPITPGGLGVVEGSLTIALVTFGGGQAATVAAVLLYRLMSFWAPLPVGGATYLALARIRHKETRRAGASALGPQSDGAGANTGPGARPVSVGVGPLHTNGSAPGPGAAAGPITGDGPITGEMTEEKRA